MISCSFLQCLYCTAVLENEFFITTTPSLYSRFPQCAMTNEPGKVWPGGIVYYAMDASLGQFLIMHVLFITCLYSCNQQFKKC